MPAPLRSSGTRKMPRDVASPVVLIGNALPSKATVPPKIGIDAEDGAGKFAAARADKAGKPQNFAPMQVERDTAAADRLRF